DLKRIKYVKRLIKRYKASGILKERLILNHIIVLSNVFSVEGAVRMLFFKLEQEDYVILKTFLIYLNMLPPWIHGIHGHNIKTTEILVDMNVARRLKEL